MPTTSLRRRANRVLNMLRNLDVESEESDKLIWLFLQKSKDEFMLDYCIG